MAVTEAEVARFCRQAGRLFPVKNSRTIGLDKHGSLLSVYRFGQFELDAGRRRLLKDRSLLLIEATQKSPEQFVRRFAPKALTIRRS